jgi:hypothetical protein
VGIPEHATAGLDQDAAVSDEPIGGPLVLRHASKRNSGTWGPDDYDVIQDGRDIGRIIKPGAGVPPHQPWMWTITGAVVAPRLTSHGFCVSLEEAKAKFAETWRVWLALHSDRIGGRPA